MPVTDKLNPAISNALEARYMQVCNFWTTRDWLDSQLLSLPRVRFLDDQYADPLSTVNPRGLFTAPHDMDLPVAGIQHTHGFLRYYQNPDDILTHGPDGHLRQLSIYRRIANVRNFPPSLTLFGRWSTCPNPVDVSVTSLTNRETFQHFTIRQASGPLNSLALFGVAIGINPRNEIGWRVWLANPRGRSGWRAPTPEERRHLRIQYLTSAPGQQRVRSVVSPLPRLLSIACSLPGAEGFSMKLPLTMLGPLPQTL